MPDRDRRRLGPARALVRLQAGLSRHPALLLVGILVVTSPLGVLASQREVVSGTEVIAPDDPSFVSDAAAYPFPRVDLATATDEKIDAATALVFGDPRGGNLPTLLSSDLDRESARSRAGLVVIRLSPDVSDAARRDAADAVESAARGAAGDLTVSVFSQPRLLAEVDQSASSELPGLLAASVLLIAVLLALTYRSALDVVLSLLGLGATIVWMFGLAVLLGPRDLGLTGDFTTVSNIIPVLLVGLGVDYALQLTWRYREERAGDVSPASSARVAVLTVGLALVLTTATTVIGFLANVASPLPPLRDFGVFAAVGVASA